MNTFAEVYACVIILSYNIWVSTEVFTRIIVQCYTDYVKLNINWTKNKY